MFNFILWKLFIIIRYIYNAFKNNKLLKKLFCITNCNIFWLNNTWYQIIIQIIVYQKLVIIRRKHSTNMNECVSIVDSN